MRSVASFLEEILKKEKKMAFLAGPRQVGKTTLAWQLINGNASSANYFNWDVPTTRKKVLKDPDRFWSMDVSTHFGVKPRIVLDEIHKYPRWKKFLKGLHDANRDLVEILVTGSGRLDVYQKGGDSLFGRYHLTHLMPFSVGELLRSSGPMLPPDTVLQQFESVVLSGAAEALEGLWQFGGFPEPFFAHDKKRLTRWQNAHRQLILREDLRDLTLVREVGLIEALIELLPERIGAPLSINNLSETLSVNFRTVQNWLQILERLYFLFAIKPYSNSLARGLRKEQKVYFYDWSEIEDEGRRFENLMAMHLYKSCLYWTDVGYGNFALHFVRDKEKRETDFLITNKKKPWILVEAKLSETQADTSLLYFHQRIKTTHGAFQVIKNCPKNWLVARPGGNITLISATRFLSCLP